MTANTPTETAEDSSDPTTLRPEHWVRELTTLGLAPKWHLLMNAPHGRAICHERERDRRELWGQALTNIHTVVALERQTQRERTPVECFIDVTTCDPNLDQLLGKPMSKR